MREVSEAQSLKSAHLRDTHARRLVLQILSRLARPSSPTEIFESAKKRGESLSPVTVYRVLDTLEAVRLVHRHPSSGLYLRCSLSDVTGHHGFLNCKSCGMIEEFHDDRLCKVEDDIASKAGFRATDHMSEIIGQCSCCV